MLAKAFSKPIWWFAALTAAILTTALWLWNEPSNSEKTGVQPKGAKSQKPLAPQAKIGQVARESLQDVLFSSKTPEENRRLFKKIIRARSDNGEIWKSFQELCRSRPYDIATLLSEHGYDSYSFILNQELGAIWAAADKITALRWIESLTSEWQKASAAFGASSVLSKAQPPQEVFAWAQGTLNERDLPDAAAVIAESALEFDPILAARWATNLSAPEIMSAASTALGRKWSSVDALDASNYVASMPKSIARDHLLNAVAEGWSLSDAKTAMKWYFDQPLEDESTRPLYIYPLISDWAGQSPSEAEKWSASLPRGEIRDQALLGVAETLDTEKPKRALDLLLQIEDSEIREDALERFQGAHPTIAIPEVSSAEIIE